jgi:hypothetical protein
MVSRWSIIDWVYSGKPAINTLKETTLRGGEVAGDYVAQVVERLPRKR